ncbi:hypothetical protein HYH03_002639 [Edaphochlamys debaryana]|uniref:Protein kinase domain-containing protein n=1 Tax=Edaphochlamys debaryana TaxID=47281 RepID=A0A836C5C6_9CHLO|nr:hypothetical protein HYH03_002639 [Edaphochlamys debaryana]|eukprot:KAG2499704.1 hypothetical protein HYH03_002639 [Edaphochlamys debaryana]
MRIALREVQVLSSLSHVNIVKLHKAFRTPSGRVCMVFGYGGTSGQQLIETGHTFGLPPPLLKRLAFQLVHSLRYLHANKVLHRDVKPANVLVDSDGVLRLCDFGFARYVSDGAPDPAVRGSERLTPYVVTRWYRAPEVLIGMPYGPAADIWSLGVTLAELATGEPLLPGESSLDQLCRIVAATGPLPGRMAAYLSRELRATPGLQPPRTWPANSGSLRSRLGGRLPAPLLELLVACLQQDPNNRPSAAELLKMPYFMDAPRMFAGTPLEPHYPECAAAAAAVRISASPAAAAATTPAQPTAEAPAAAAATVQPEAMSVDASEEPAPPPAAAAKPAPAKRHVPLSRRYGGFGDHNAIYPTRRSDASSLSISINGGGAANSGCNDAASGAAATRPRAAAAAAVASTILAAAAKPASDSSGGSSSDATSASGSMSLSTADTSTRHTTTMGMSRMGSVDPRATQESNITVSITPASSLGSTASGAMAAAVDVSEDGRGAACGGREVVAAAAVVPTGDARDSAAGNDGCRQEAIESVRGGSAAAEALARAVAVAAVTITAPAAFVTNVPRPADGASVFSTAAAATSLQHSSSWRQGSMNRRVAPAAASAAVAASLAATQAPAAAATAVAAATIEFPDSGRRDAAFRAMASSSALFSGPAAVGHERAMAAAAAAAADAPSGAVAPPSAMRAPKSRVTDSGYVGNQSPALRVPVLWPLQPQYGEYGSFLNGAPAAAAATATAAAGANPTGLTRAEAVDAASSSAPLWTLPRGSVVAGAGVSEPQRATAETDMGMARPHRMPPPMDRAVSCGNAAAGMRLEPPESTASCSRHSGIGGREFGMNADGYALGDAGASSGASSRQLPPALPGSAVPMGQSFNGGMSTSTTARWLDSAMGSANARSANAAAANAATANGYSENDACCGTTAHFSVGWLQSTSPDLGGGNSITSPAARAAMLASGGSSAPGEKGKAGGAAAPSSRRSGCGGGQSAGAAGDGARVPLGSTGSFGPGPAPHWMLRRMSGHHSAPQCEPGATPGDNGPIGLWSPGADSFENFDSRHNCALLMAQGAIQPGSSAASTGNGMSVVTPSAAGGCMQSLPIAPRPGQGAGSMPSHPPPVAAVGSRRSSTGPYGGSPRAQSLLRPVAEEAPWQHRMSSDGGSAFSGALANKAAHDASTGEQARASFEQPGGVAAAGVAPELAATAVVTPPSGLPRIRSHSQQGARATPPALVESAEGKGAVQAGARASLPGGGRAGHGSEKVSKTSASWVKRGRRWLQKLLS